MIVTAAYDVEVLPNFFSVTVIDLGSYLGEFADCTNDKGKPVPIVQKHTVAETIAKLNNVASKVFYITADDDHELLDMIKYFEDMRPHRNEDGIAVSHHVFGFNSGRYDKLMIAGLLMFYRQCKDTKDLITRLYELSKHIIELQDSKEDARKDYLINSLYKYNLPYTDIDVMSIFALNKVGKMKKADGTTAFYGKSLKQTSINLQWYELLEHELPPISDKDIAYYDSQPRYKGMTAEQLNRLVDKWDRYIIPEWIEPTLHYNKNDVFIVCEIVRLYIDEIKLRYSLKKAYGIDCLSSSRSNIADRLFVKFYSEFSGLAPSQWRGQKTERTSMSFKRVIFPFIEFKTPELKAMLADMKRVVVHGIGKDAFIKEIKLGNLTYTIATGGLHSQDRPRELRSKLILGNHLSTGDEKRTNLAIAAGAAGDIWSDGNITDDSYVYIHWDISSFYPSIMSVYDIAPAHINQQVFTKLVTWLKDTRVAAKHSKEPLVNGIPKGIVAQALKIVINSIYGKLGYELGDICDKLAVLRVTINGQLMIMMLCEELETNGIEVVSANTDGIVVKLYKSKKDTFDKISEHWKDLTKLSADSEEYDCYINSNINNYVDRQLTGKVEYKGALNPFMYLVDLSKGYSMPIVAQAAVNYFLDDKPIMNSLYDATNILDFCITQNVGRQFHVEYTEGNSVKRTVLQRYVRFYVANDGGIIEKVRDDTGARSKLASGYRVKVLNTLDDKRIEYRNINYNYYYQEVMKIVNPIKLGIDPKMKGDPAHGIKSGKVLLKKYNGMFNDLFDNVE